MSPLIQGLNYRSACDKKNKCGQPSACNYFSNEAHIIQLSLWSMI